MTKKHRTDVRFDFVDKLPDNVPPVEQQPTTLFPFPPPVGPAQATYYFPIPLDGCNPTGVFFPSGFQFTSPINVLLYFHGHKLGEFTTINEYWHGDLHGIKLREDVNAAGKNLVLIAPTMGENPGSSLNSDMGIFRKPGAGDDFLDEVRRWIGKYVPQYVAKKLTPSIGKVALAGHSGAGGILSQQAKTMKANVCEVWGFDSMYGEGWVDKAHKQAIDVAGNWIKTAQKRQTVEIQNVGILPLPKWKPTTWFYFYWATSSPGANAKDLQDRIRTMGLTNVIVEKNDHVGGKYHFDSLTANFRKRVAASRCF